jgi:hypothetical protein
MPELVTTHLTSGETAAVGVSPAGTPVRPESVDVSASGDRVAFVATGTRRTSSASPGSADPNLKSALMVRDRTAAATTWVPVPSDLGAAPSTLPVREARLSADARRVLATIELDDVPRTRR